MKFKERYSIRNIIISTVITGSFLTLLTSSCNPKPEYPIVAYTKKIETEQGYKTLTLWSKGDRSDDWRIQFDGATITKEDGDYDFKYAPDYEGPEWKLEQADSLYNLITQ